MLEDQSVGALAPDPPGARDAPDALSSPSASRPPAPDPVVVDSARLRLAALRAQAAAQPVGQLGETASAGLIDDILAIDAVLASARGDLGIPADALDVGAALVVLGDLRTHIDHLETGLLDAAERVGLNWDVIAAIIGIPADEAQRRHRRLRGRQASP
jgi:hypothetical protein